MNATTLDFNFKYYHRLAKTITGKSWKFSRLFCQDQDQDQDQDSGSQDQDQDQDFIFVLEAPWDQDFGLEDYITAQISRGIGMSASFKIYCTCEQHVVYCLKLLFIVEMATFPADQTQHE